MNFDSIEALKIDMVQKQFSGRYLRELINKLKRYKPNIFNNVDYTMLMDMIERRNIHLHNKEFVDNKYCNLFNIYKLSIDNYAYIDSDYLLKYLILYINLLQILKKNFVFKRFLKDNLTFFKHLY